LPETLLLALSGFVPIAESTPRLLSVGNRGR